MDWINILGQIGIIGGGVSIIELLRWLYTRKTEKKGLELDNKQKEQNIKSGTIEEWEKLTEQHNNTIDYYREQMAVKDSTIAEKDAIIEHKNDKIQALSHIINNLTSENTALKLYRCLKTACVDRLPPFGIDKINIKDGTLIETDETMNMPEEEI